MGSLPKKRFAAKPRSFAIIAPKKDGEKGVKKGNCSIKGKRNNERGITTEDITKNEEYGNIWMPRLLLFRKKCGIHKICMVRYCRLKRQNNYSVKKCDSRREQDGKQIQEKSMLLLRNMGIGRHRIVFE